MRYIQMIAACVLIASLALLYSLSNTQKIPTKIITIREEGFEVTNEKLIKSLLDEIGGYEGIEHKSIDLNYSNTGNIKKEISYLTDQDIVIGCLTLTCQLIILDFYNDKPRSKQPTFFLIGRMPGLKSHDRIWNFGSTFTQNLIPPILKIINLIKKPIILIGDESVHSKLSLSIVKSYLKSKTINWEYEIYIASKNEIDIKISKEKLNNHIIINATCSPFRHSLFNFIKDTNSIRYHLCGSPNETRTETSSDWFYSTKNKAISPEDLAIDRVTSVIKRIKNTSLKDINLRNIEFYSDSEGVSVMDHLHQSTWNHIFINNSEGNVKIVDSLVKPQIYPNTRQPSEWDLELMLYWRNHNGLWHNY